MHLNEQPQRCVRAGALARPRVHALGWALGIGIALGQGLVALPAQARPSGPVKFCEAYPSSPDCMGRFATCDTCHTSTEPPAWNQYGASLLAELAGEDFDAGLPAAMARVEDVDADGDGETNLDEILVGTNPGNAESIWLPVPEVEGDENPWYAVGSYDPHLAFRRAMTLYCGQSPSYAQRQDFAALPDDEKREALHHALSICLDGEYWRDLGLRELADKRVRPLFAIGADTNVEIQGIRVALADYWWDYRMWRYILSDDRDLRELLTATYHVDDDGAGGLVPIDGPIPGTFALGTGGQPLPAEHRAGMLTTQWFLMSNTMFSGLPRTTAAHAYRAFLGMDISKDEGIVPVAGEPLDVDHKGVTEPTCAVCHSTLDPLAYAFAYYRGITSPVQDTGTYDPERPAELIPNWDPERQQSMLLGQPVRSVVEWGQVASQSPYFRQAMVEMFFEHALGRPVEPANHEEVAAIVDTVVDDGHSANRIIHRIVDTEAFGAP